MVNATTPLKFGAVRGRGGKAERSPRLCESSPCSGAADAIDALEIEVGRLRGTIERLQSQARRVELPRLNLPVFEVLPGSLVRRGAGDDGNVVVLPAGATEVVLLLSADGPAEAPASLTIQDAAGREAWRGDGLRFGPPGGYVVAVPAAMLPEGAYLLTVRPARGAAIVYRIRIRHGR